MNQNDIQQKKKEIKENKCTCEVCQNIWFYGKSDESEVFLNKVSNVGKALACCGGCWPALLIHDKEIRDLDKCPKCGSRQKC